MMQHFVIRCLVLGVCSLFSVAAAASIGYMEVDPPEPTTTTLITLKGGIFCATYEPAQVNGFMIDIRTQSLPTPCGEPYMFSPWAGRLPTPGTYVVREVTVVNGEQKTSEVLRFNVANDPAAIPVLHPLFKAVLFLALTSAAVISLR